MRFELTNNLVDEKIYFVSGGSKHVAKSGMEVKRWHKICDFIRDEHLQ
jgi:hypothetical protein